MPDAARRRRRYPRCGTTDLDLVSRSDDAEPAALRLGVAGTLALVAVGGAVDLALDAPTSWRSVHVAVELTVMTLSLALALYLWIGWHREARAAAAGRRAMLARQATLQAERDAWRESARAAAEGLTRAIDRQFDLWRLTAAEREVALMLLEGLGHKQIAARTGRGEKTVRQHAGVVYQKAGLAGRAELAAFFLDGLLSPRLTGPASS